MRIIGGKHKGKAILPPNGYKARPTTDFAKEGLFNVLEIGRASGRERVCQYV